jgi:glycosyltransferase involved in cell wall biosynthesis
MSDGGESGGRAVRVVYQQPACPKYRVPVYDELAGRPGIDLKVVFASDPNLENAAAGKAWAVPEQHRVMAGGRLFWHSTQLTYATRKRADVLVMTWNTRYLSLLPALVKARLNGVRTILWGHGYSKDEGALRGWMRRAYGRMATCVQLYNHMTAERLIAGGMARERVHVALNALDQRPMREAAAEWRGDPARLAAFKREKGLDAGPVALFVSRLMEDYHIDILIDAVSRLRKSGRCPSVRAVIVGKGPDEARLRARARELGVEEAVLFTGAIYEERGLAPYFLSADVFCYPVNIGLSLLHALGYGLPVVTADSIESQNPEIEALAPGENGLLYRNGDTDSLADTLARLFEDRALRDRLAAGALKTATERFTLKNMVDGMVGAIEYCMSV